MKVLDFYFRSVFFLFLFYLAATSPRPQPISGKLFTHMPLSLVTKQKTSISEICRVSGGGENIYKFRFSIDPASTNSDTSAKWESISKPGVNVAIILLIFSKLHFRAFSPYLHNGLSYSYRLQIWYSYWSVQYY